MSKAVLVLDEMPKSCDLCAFCEIYETPSGVMVCNNPLSEEYGCYVSDYIGARPEGCPLRELPGKAYHENFCDNGRYDKGWLSRDVEWYFIEKEKRARKIAYSTHATSNLIVVLAKKIHKLQ